MVDTQQTLGKKHKIVIIGTGKIARESIKSLINKANDKVTLPTEIIVLGRNIIKIDAEIHDTLSAYFEVNPNITINVTTDKEAALSDANIIIHAIGQPARALQFRNRLFELPLTASLVIGYSKLIKKLAPHSINITVSNPTEIYARNLRELTGLPQNQIIAMGITLDSTRFKNNLERLLRAHGAPLSLTECYMIGGHEGRFMLPIISQIKVNGILAKEYFPPQAYKQFFALAEKAAEETYNEGFDLAMRKGESSSTGPAGITAEITAALLGWRKKLITPVGLVIDYIDHSKYNPTNLLSIGKLSEISTSGVKELNLPMSAKEKAQYSFIETEMSKAQVITSEQLAELGAHWNALYEYQEKLMKQLVELIKKSQDTNLRNQVQNDFPALFYSNEPALVSGSGMGTFHSMPIIQKNHFSSVANEEDPQVKKSNSFNGFSNFLRTNHLTKNEENIQKNHFSTAANEGGLGVKKSHSFNGFSNFSHTSQIVKNEGNWTSKARSVNLMQGLLKVIHR